MRFLTISSFIFVSTVCLSAQEPQFSTLADPVPYSYSAVEYGPFQPVEFADDEETLKRLDGPDVYAAYLMARENLKNNRVEKAVANFFHSNYSAMESYRNGQPLTDGQIDYLSKSTGAFRAKLHQRVQVMTGQGHAITSDSELGKLVEDVSFEVMSEVAGSAKVPGVGVVRQIYNWYPQKKWLDGYFEDQRDSVHRAETRSLLFGAEKDFANTFGWIKGAGDRDPRIKGLVNEHFDWGVDVWGKQKDNEQKNPLFATQTKLNELDVKSMSTEQLKEKFTEVMDRIDAKSLESQTAIIQHLESEKIEEEKKQLNREFKQQDYDTASSTVNLLSLAARGLGEEDLAKGMMAVGNSAIQVAQELDKYSSVMSNIERARQLDLSIDFSGREFLGTVNLISGIANVVSSLFSALMGIKSTDQIILEEIMKLQKQVASLRENMNNRFDHVDRSITEMFVAMEEGFKGVRHQFDRVQYDLNKLQYATTKIRAQLNQMQRTLSFFIAEGFEAQVEKEAQVCLRRQDVDFDYYSECVHKLSVFAAYNSRNGLQAGGAATLPTDPVDMFSNFADKLAGGLWGEIETIRAALASDRYQFNAHSVTNAKLANAAYWSKYAQRYVQYYVRFPEFAEKLNGEALASTRELITAGEDLNAYASDLRADNRSETRGSSVFSKVLTDYAALLATLENTILAELVEHEKENFANYKIDKKASEQVVSHKPFFPKLHVCADSKVKQELENPAPIHPELDAPVNMVSMIPAEVRMAAHLGLVALHLCYESVDWERTEHRDINEGEQHIFSLPTMQLRLSATHKNLTGEDVTEVIFRRKVTGTEEVKHGVVVYKTKVISKGFKDNPAPTVIKREGVAWAHGDKHPRAEDGSWKITGLKLLWNGPTDNMYKNFAEKSVEQLTTDQQTQMLANITGLIENRRAVLRNAFTKSVQRDIKADTIMGDALKALTGAKMLLENLVTLAYPGAMEGSDELRARFYGAPALIDVKWAIPAKGKENEGPKWADIRNFIEFEASAQEAERLRSIIAGVSDSNLFTQPSVIVSSILKQLKTLERAQLMSRQSR